MQIGFKANKYIAELAKYEKKKQWQPDLGEPMKS